MNPETLIEREIHVPTEEASLEIELLETGTDAAAAIPQRPAEQPIVDPVHLFINLRLHPKPVEIEDKARKNHLLDQTALYLQNSLVIDTGEPARHRFEEAYEWLEEATAPTRQKIFRKYSENSRINLDDFEQIVRAHTIEEIIPQFDPSRGSFLHYYKSVAWRRLQEHIYKSASQFSTITHLGEASDEDKQRALSATSYDAMVAWAGMDAEPNDFMEAPDSEDDPNFRMVMIRNLLKQVVEVSFHFSEGQRTSLALKVLGFSYDEIAKITGISPKGADNRVYKARLKLAGIDTSIMEDLY